MHKWRCFRGFLYNLIKFINNKPEGGEFDINKLCPLYVNRFQVILPAENQ